jgi:protein involved in polysaccharide export with SLBB domain
MLESQVFRVWFRATLLMAAISCGQALSAQVIPIPQPIAPADYRIRVGDILEVWVYQHPDLSRRFVVNGDGNRTLMVNGMRVSPRQRWTG